MRLRLVSEQEYQDTVKEIARLKQENTLLQQRLNKPDISVHFTSDVDSIMDAKFSFNNLTISNGLQEAFIEYVKNSIKPAQAYIENKIEKLNKEAYDSKLKELDEKIAELKKNICDVKANQLKYVSKYINETVPDVIKCTEELKHMCDHQKIIKYVRADDTKEFADCIINSLNNILTTIPTPKECDEIGNKEIENLKNMETEGSIIDNLDFEEKEFDIE